MSDADCTPGREPRSVAASYIFSTTTLPSSRRRVTIYSTTTCGIRLRRQVNAFSTTSYTTSRWFLLVLVRSSWVIFNALHWVIWRTDQLQEPVPFISKRSRLLQVEAEDQEATSQLRLTWKITAKIVSMSAICCRCYYYYISRES